MIKRTWPIIVATGMLTAAGFAHGWRTERWGATPDMLAAASRLEQLPMTIGDWEGVVVTLPPEQIAATRVLGLVTRRYTHRYTRAEVSVMVMCSRPGEAAVHTPDVCYRGAGFETGPSRVEELPGGHSFWVADFTKNGAPPLRIRWAWSTSREWKASKAPRIDFARSPILYKLYLIQTATLSGDVPNQAPESAFANEFIPALNATIYPVG